MKKIQNKHFILDQTYKSSKDTVNILINIFRAAYFKLRMNFININSTKKKYNVSICAIFKNEASYLREWIEFNRIVGIEHFYLYNNNSDDEYQRVLKPYIDAGLVTLIQWPKNQAQMECYCNCIENYRTDTQWLGFIDIDEFVVPVRGNSVYDLLKPFEKNRGSVKLYWKMFGTSGMIQRDVNTLVTETLIVSWPKYYSVGKCFYNTNFDFDSNYKMNNCLHHTFWSNYKGKNYPPVNMEDKVCFENYNRVKDDCHAMQINHYFTKSFMEYGMKKSKGDVFYNINPHDEEYFYLHEMENTSVDYSAYKYLIRLKIALDNK